MINPDNFCRYCNGHTHDCHWCEGTGQNFAIFGLSMDHERAHRDAMRKAQYNAEEAVRWDGRKPFVDPDDAENMAQWAEFMNTPSPSEKPNKQSDAWVNATIEWRKHRNGPAPKWEDFA